MSERLITELPEEIVRERYALFCVISESESANMNIQQERLLLALEQIIEQSLPELARKGSPNNFTELQQALRLEMVRFREFCEYPELPTKIVVGLGGSFSAGKSSLINRLLDDRKCLVTQVDPTTSLPTYLITGLEDKTQVRAINIFNRVVSLSHEQFSTLTHEEKQRYGSKASRLLKSVIVSHPHFHWQNIALLDTPGYSKPDEVSSDRTDANLARTQLNSAQFIIWLVPADKGTITEEDIAFLASLKHEIPKLVIISRADKHPQEDIKRIVELVRSTLLKRGLQILDVLPFTDRGKDKYPLEPLTSWLDQWNNAPRNLGFAEQFKRQFMSWQRFIDEKHQRQQRLLSKFNRILTLSDDDDIQDDILTLQRQSKSELSNIELLKQHFTELQAEFFHRLKIIGDSKGIPLPEPDAISLLDLPAINMTEMLTELAKEQDIILNDFDTALWMPLAQDVSIHNLDKILRRDQLFNIETWEPLTQKLPLTGEDILLRKVMHHYPELTKLQNLD